MNIQLFIHPESTDSKMADILYVNVYGPTELNKEVVYDYPTGVVIGEDKIATSTVEMTSNPAYRTVTCSEECVSTKLL